ncbi:MAG: NAD-dependent epimerase/dehydratase family protein, partial [Candidatus Moraniibacteriota bacterium]
MSELPLFPTHQQLMTHNREKRLLVTGGAGFIGSHIVDALVDLGYRVFILDDLSSGKEENLNPKAKFYKCDLTDLKKTDRLFAKIHPYAIFHLGAQIKVGTSVQDPVADATTNIVASVNLMRLSEKYGVEKFIFSSTSAVYGNTRIIPTPETAATNPLSPYAISKLTVERYLKFYHDTYGLNATILRYANVYGPRQNAEGESGVIAVFLSKMLRDETPTINGDGEQTRDYVYVSDVVAANLMALERPKISGVFNVGTSEQTSVNEVFERLNRQFDNRFEAVQGLLEHLKPGG